MSRFDIQWAPVSQRWVVVDKDNDRAYVGDFPSCHEAEQYVIERGSRAES